MKQMFLLVSSQESRQGTNPQFPLSTSRIRMRKIQINYKQTRTVMTLLLLTSILYKKAPARVIIWNNRSK